MPQDSQSPERQGAVSLPSSAGDPVFDEVMNSSFGRFLLLPTSWNEGTAPFVAGENLNTLLLVRQLVFKLGGRRIKKGIRMGERKGAPLKWRIYDFVYRGGFGDYKSPSDSISRKTAQTDAVLSKSLGIRVAHFTNRDPLTGAVLREESRWFAQQFGISIVQIDLMDLWRKKPGRPVVSRKSHWNGCSEKGRLTHGDKLIW